MVQLYHTATEYIANEITFIRGAASDINSVGVFHSQDPDEIPAVEDFTAVALATPGHQLAEGDRVDVLSLIGPRDGDVDLVAGDWQRWVLIQTATEDIIRRVDVLEVL